MHRKKKAASKFRDKTWDFRKADTKQHTHCFHQYPAMMIPQVAGRILDEFGNNSKLLFDPYCGTGTSLVEANIRGIDAIGTDINPLARLIAQVKTTRIPLGRLDQHLKEYNDFMFSVKTNKVNVSPKVPEFKNIDYWFKKKTQFWLAAIKEYIQEIDNKRIQSFFKVAFCETVRDVSLTRNSEFKLYRMSDTQIAEFNPDALTIMFEKLIRNRNGLATYLSVKKNKASSKIYNFNTVFEKPENIVYPRSVNIVVTSPPYGDSRTTVAYGQFSRLASQWLGFEGVNDVDRISMGGVKKDKFKIFDFKPLDTTVQKIAKKDVKRAHDVNSFYIDYEKSINNVSSMIKKGGIVAYVVGNRRVKDVEIPNDEITCEFFRRNNCTYIKTILREIPNKRMPKRNSPSNVSGKTGTTMNYEYIVVLQKRR